jgi:two-component system cell cycle sensor histidine kinase/response regulator CckA
LSGPPFHDGDLAQRLAEAEATIEALLSNQIDAVVDPKSNTPVLLSKAQEALRQSEERYRRIVETTREGVWMIDASHKTTFMNQRMAEMLRCGSDRCLGSSPFDFLDDGEGAKLAAYLQRTAGGQIDIRYTRKDGTSVWTLLEAAPVVDRHGRYEGSLAMVVDITERKQAETAVRHERDRAESYLDAAEVIMLAIDVDGRITMINRYGRSVLGWTSDELLGKDWIGTCAPARVQDSLRATLHGFLQANRSDAGAMIVENPIVSKSGEERLIEWRSSVLRDDHGIAIGVIASGTDITDRTQAVADLRTAEERMRFALESAEVGIWDMDYQTGVLSWSATLEKQYGLPPGSFDGAYKSFVALIHPDDRQTTLDAVTKAEEAGTDFSLHNRVVRPDGTVRTLDGVGRIYLDGSGKPVRGVGISLDVTERRLLERQYQMANKMDAIGQLASGVAHDFNNLLTVILGFAEFVTEDTSIAAHHRRDVGEIIKAARRASGLTKQLLAFSRQQVLETIPLDLNRLITDMTGMLRRLIGEHIEVNLNLAPRLPLALSDRGQLEQVVMNLLVNARDAMPAGGAVTIKTTYVELDDLARDNEPTAGGHYVLLAVTDTGTGMSKETQRRLFEPFYTTKDTGKGTGLGLSTAYGIIKQSKGYIYVDSQAGLGTTFRVYLPCADAAAFAAEAYESAAPSAARASETLLLVEDEAAVREFSVRILEREGYRVFVAENGDEAHREFAERAAEIDLVLTDVVMPGCGGPELLRRLRLRRANLKVLYMSGYTEQSAANVMAFRDAPAILQKPFSAADLRRRVRSVLDVTPLRETL